MKARNNQIIVLAQSLEQPRIIKRIIEKSTIYDKVFVYGFNRKIHRVNNYDVLTKYDNIVLFEVASFSNQKYLGRLLSYFKLIYLLYKNYGLKKKYLYVFGIDLRIISTLIINSEVDYEISDIMWLYKKKLQKFILKNIDFFLVKNSHNVIFTSLGFYKKYYFRYLPSEKVILKENKFKTYGKVRPVNNLKKDKIRVAYIGAFRYASIINSLIEVVSKNSNTVLNFYGDGNMDVVENIKSASLINKNILYHGAFKNPDDLHKIYSENNLNFVVYNNNLLNEKVAMPNKYYESGFFNIPIVCAEKTYVAERVFDNQLGWAIGISFEDIQNFLNSLTIEEVEKYHKKIKALDKSLFQI